MKPFTAGQRQLWLLGLLWAVLTLQPINRLSLRLGWLLLTAGLVAYLLWRGRRSRRLWLVLGVLAAAVSGWFTVGRRPVTEAELRAAYVDALRSYEGVGYVWGGEGRLGIDCSGLVRRGFIDANLRLGLTHGDAYSLVLAAFVWWYDQSAEGLRTHAWGMTVPFRRGVVLARFDHAPLRPGDIMVTTSGVHCMVYLGNGEWLNADPTAGEVFSATVPDPRMHWFLSPAEIVSWRWLAY